MGGGVLYSQRESYENAVQKIADISAAEYHKYNIVITVFDLHKNYLNQMFKKRNAKVRYKNESLAQVNPQLHEWLEIIDARLCKTNIADNGQSVNTKYSERWLPE